MTVLFHASTLSANPAKVCCGHSLNWRLLTSASRSACGELGDGIAGIESNVLATDLASPEFPDMQEPKRDPAAITRNSKKGTRDRARPGIQIRGSPQKSIGNPHAVRDVRSTVGPCSAVQSANRMRYVPTLVLASERDLNDLLVYTSSRAASLLRAGRQVTLVMAALEACSLIMLGDLSLWTQVCLRRFFSMNSSSNLARMAAAAYLYDHLSDLPVWFRSLTPGRLQNIADVIVQGRLPMENQSILPMEEIEKREILRVLAICNGSTSEAAKLLNMGQTTIYKKLKKWGYSVQNRIVLESALGNRV